MLNGLPLSARSGGGEMTDGLYRVETHYLCAGFVVKDDTIISCAPILWKRMSYWLTIAKRIGNDPLPGASDD